MKTAAVLALSTALIATGTVVGIQGAEAATGGVGWGTFGNTSSKYAGTFTEDGARLVCGQPGAAYPTGYLNNAGYWDSYNGVTGNQLAGINRVLSENIDTGDRNTAAALEYAVARVVDPNAGHRNFAGQYMASYDDVINFDLYSTAGSGNVQAIQRIANDLVNTINSTTAGSGGQGSGRLDFAVDAANNYNGTVTMNGTAGSVGTITLTNGVFTDTGSNTHEAVAGAAYGVRGVPPTEDGAPYKISGTGRFTPPGQEGYAANVRVWNPTVNGQQRSLSPGEKVGPQVFDVSGGDPQDRATTFRPVLSTTAQAFVQRGAPFSDTVRFSTVADSNGLNNPWYRSPSTGKAVPILAEGTIYGPYDKPAAQALDQVPAGAPVAGHMTLTTGDSGPDIEYTVQSTETATTTGYYYYVWTIDAANQSNPGRYYLPSGYVFTDQFGLSAEQSTVPMRITATTQVPEPTVPLSGVPADVATVDADGYWLHDAAGNPIPVVVRWDAYLDPRESGIDEVDVSKIPLDATLLGTIAQTVTAEGEAKTPAAAALGFSAPASGKGSIVWVASVRDADQGTNADHIEEWTDRYGVPTEIQVIAQPVVTTAATVFTPKGGEIQDTATVTGTLPATGAELAFDAYQVPMKQDPTTGVWAPDVADGDLTKVCTDANRIYSNVGAGQQITTTGEYTSPKVTASNYGTIFWVESLWSIPTTPGDKPEQISRGECAVPSETTHIIDVSTKASSVDGSKSVTPGSAVQDTATVIGSLPEGSAIVFDAYRGEPGQPVCSDTTRVWTSTVTTLVGGYYSADKPLQPTSEAFTPEQLPADTALWFVETVRDKDGRTIAQGECGAPEETLALANSVKALAVTGTDVPVLPLLLVGGSALPVGVALAGLVVIDRRRKSAINDR
ncbi:hypothetical protein [Microbacterium testaceum]|uniref:hypothetical protein n=1 Tax=Microbacterium testaceum TaxID=2033 RepID=UPI002AC78696|nr:hypothetical protein [Microbacterium testaceum]MDZ5146320.1 hypothetical protein [Microbacterium testaceum]